MHFLLLSVVIVTLFLIAVQDCKYRAVPVFLFVILFVAVFLLTSIQNTLRATAMQLLVNGLVTAFLITALLLVYYLKERSIKFFFEQKMGPGDVLLWFCAAPLFSTINYLIWFIGSLVVVLFIHFLRLAFSTKKIHQTVPLAGLQAMLLLSVIFLNELFFHKDLSLDVVSLTPFTT